LTVFDHAYAALAAAEVGVEDVVDEVRWQVKPYR
jgi:hypothetical protein